MESFIFLEYSTLKFLWWVFLGVLLVGFAVTDGFDLGVATLLPLVARSDNERRVLINSIGPVWEGNQVWLITAGGAIFAAWPLIYSASFSGFYLAMLLVLIALIIRPVGFKYRSKVESSTWRNSWDYLLCFSGIVASLVFGVAIGNIILGVPIGFDHVSLRVSYNGNFLGLFRPFSLVTGILSVVMLAMHGANFLALKTEGVVQERSVFYGEIFSFLTAFIFVFAGFLVKNIDGQIITSIIDYNCVSNPLLKIVESQKGAWLLNYYKWPIACIAPLIGTMGPIVSFMAIRKQYYVSAFIGSSLGITAIIVTVGVSLFPFLMPSSFGNYSSGLTVWDASSSHLTLWVMFLSTLLFLPIVIAYTSFVYMVMRGKVNDKSVAESHNSY
ncbi:cytochrome bd-I oxidase subunit II [Candidatus Kinetoplastibacterium blastocrithidii TCC012E]|uniref:Cytochrome bd-I oxidase subunit II n=1 Tax=Candidatus Kinetoplastidibacterium blastocrithidiae TCC012E TaxID=1208922 RepID=M1LC97_9PROT|nr:cytochrome d ubiquinol oxidase subunit II [Candidatus Kinetoplastibacterium blastocrithidii]AFZ83254.1 cytochrome d ubiquinol oxidase subunit II 2 [Candidatus Kinetoplastibacterium blastocrithidii (ex Strigomonas culicis)]AGF50068.1 cytochrome bd-I oxidase subunit II [Candidatus Kinetoplastibacterium blastocrithidii TCC012E]